MDKRSLHFNFRDPQVLDDAVDMLRVVQRDQALKMFITQLEIAYQVGRVDRNDEMVEWVVKTIVGWRKK